MFVRHYCVDYVSVCICIRIVGCDYATSVHHRFSAFNSAQISWKMCATLLGCLSLTFRWSSSHTSPMEFKAPSKISVEWLSVALCFCCIFGWVYSCALLIILRDYSSLSYNSLHCRRNRVMLQYTVIAVLIQCSLHLVQIPDLVFGKSPPHHNRASFMFYGFMWYRDLQLFH